jgi:phage tail-like protein
MRHGTNPHSAFIFIFGIDGAEVASFSEVSAVTTDDNVVEYREGEDADGALHKLRGLHKFNQITLKRGYSISEDLWNWWQAVRQGKAHRKSGIIVLLNEGREPVLRWAIKDAWINKWEGPTLRPKTNEVAIESLEIVCEGIALTN